jgi:hypothetical protein
MPNRPKVESVADRSAIFSHSNFLGSCITCHESIRPTASTHLNSTGTVVTSTTHYQPQDCSSCHSPSGWAFTHSPAQVLCSSCHEIKRPSTVNGTAHVASGDCVNCHTINTWQSFDHSANPSSCLTCHTSIRPTVNKGHNSKSKGHYNSVQECKSCHAIPQIPFGNQWNIGASNTCILCHLAKGQSEHGSSANSGGNHTSCGSCHNPLKNGW